MRNVGNVYFNYFFILIYLILFQLTFILHPVITFLMVLILVSILVLVKYNNPGNPGNQVYFLKVREQENISVRIIINLIALLISQLYVCHERGIWTNL